ncbi:hypothetical protein SH580_06640 [Coraliomargarita algicola]|uniref:Uncharacterized protein n=1 Tax=Coraliomargarita algicola TaxID=3092156 RepID=A0ABZ0RRH2_9BACT|nr:hypothetical protein [Coraliomargarita sp. J2-16]WPJ97385.1 hypothetical protein SH580_06640 [Coraliomargarita sp. J2-16]
MKSHLGNIIYELVENNQGSIQDLATKVPNTNSSTFSKIRAGSYVRISDERLEAIAEALAKDSPGIKTEIICEYLKDMCPRNFRHLIAIKPKKALSPQHRHESSGINETLDILGQAAAKDTAFKTHLDSLRTLAESVIESKRRNT